MEYTKEFLPTCEELVKKADALKAKGVELIVCVSVNDPFVMDAFGKAHNATGKVLKAEIVFNLFICSNYAWNDASVVGQQALSPTLGRS